MGSLSIVHGMGTYESQGTNEMLDMTFLFLIHFSFLLSLLVRLLQTTYPWIFLFFFSLENWWKSINTMVGFESMLTLDVWVLCKVVLWKYIAVCVLKYKRVFTHTYIQIHTHTLLLLFILAFITRKLSSLCSVPDIPHPCLGQFWMVMETTQGNIRVSELWLKLNIFSSFIEVSWINKNYIYLI